MIARRLTVRGTRNQGAWWLIQPMPPILQSNDRYLEHAPMADPKTEANPDTSGLVPVTVLTGYLGDKEQSIEENDGTIRMDVSTFNQGIYICSLESEGKTLVTRRLVVTH